MNKLYDLLKYIIYASFYMIVIKTGMDFYGYKRFPKLYESYSAPWYTEALLYIAAPLFVIVVCFVLRVIISIILMVIAALVGFFFGAGMNEAMGGAILLSMITGFACTINAIEKNKKD